jgi:hypothetical protein
VQSNHDATLESPLMCNLVTWLWFCINIHQPLAASLSKYFALAKLYIVMILGNVEYEHCFSALSFLKSKFHSWLTIHLDLVVKMFAYDHHTLDFLLRMPWKIRMSIRWDMHHTSRFLICYANISWCKFFYYFYCTCN